MKLPDAVLNSHLSTPELPVWLIEAIPCSAGDTFEVALESAEPRWRQGVWLAVEGELEVASEESPQFILWKDTAPPRVPVRILSTSDGLLRLYNVWDSGRGHTCESQAHTSGMLREELPNGTRYRCSDINPEPTYEAIVFRVERSTSAAHPR